MSKSKKKRNKKYAGIDAKTDDNFVTVHKVTASDRGAVRQWLYEHKKIIRVICIALVIIIVIATALVSLFSH